MYRLLAASVTALGCFFFVSPEASAQAYPYARPPLNPYSTPPVSPYLNLLGGTNPAVNYYLQTVPNFQQRALNSLFSSELRNLEIRDLTPSLIDSEDLPTLAGTGHAVQFMNYSPYYNLGLSRQRSLQGQSSAQQAPPPKKTK